jgi:NTE family protein
LLIFLFLLFKIDFIAQVMVRKMVLHICLLLLPVFVMAETVERPRVGLVLSGGGAKGFAHIGVLKVLEEAGIRPDYITGTSMGSIIGGLYAIGYTASELDSIARVLDWGQLLSDRVLLSDVIPEEKLDYQRFQVELDITPKGLKVPAGFVGGQSISETFSRLSARVAGVDSFAHYPIPFKCVAADLITGNQVVLDHGSFANALRASMSIPSVFSPVVMDSLLLIDGGVLNNFPVHLCQRMGADIIIGVNVGGADKLQLADLTSPLSVLSASAMIANSITMRRQISEVDILISPDLAPYNAGSFFDGPQIIMRGEEAAREKLDELLRLSQRLDSIGEKGVLIVPSAPETYFIDQIKMEGVDYISSRFFMSSLGISKGDVVTLDQVAKGLSRLMGTRYFESVTYDLKPAEDGYVLTVHATESARARLKFSLHYDNEYKAGIFTNITLRNVLARGNRLSTTFDISERPRLNTSIIGYFGENHRTATELDLVWENNNFPVYLEGGNRYGSFIHNYTDLTLGFMSSLDTKWLLSAYMEMERSVLKQQSGFYELFSSGVEKFGNVFISANFSANRNTVNRRFFPTRGSEFSMRYRFYIDNSALYKGNASSRGLVADAIDPLFEQFFSVTGYYQVYLSLHDRLVVSPRLQGSYSNRALPLPGLNFIGGMPFQRRSNEVSFVGLSSREKIVQDFAMAQLNFRYRFLRNMHVTGIVNALVSHTESASEFQPVVMAKDESIFGYGLLFEYDSFLGPIQFGASNSNVAGGLRWYLGIGYPF